MRIPVPGACALLINCMTGSAVADYAFDQIGGLSIRPYRSICLGSKLIRNRLADRLPQIYYTLHRLSVDTGAFEQLTRKYMSETFNPNTPDVDDVRCVTGCHLQHQCLTAND